MEVLLPLWRELYSQRLVWAESAYAEFLKQIDPELTRYFAGHEKEVYVALYGRTQVGKTTLLLKLMGANPVVSKILRGGRGKGRSATATATRYSASSDDYWRLTSDNNDDDMLDDAGIENELMLLRKRVEGGDFFSDSPVTIKIPLKYFHEERKHTPKVHILDLPGENASNESEALHVRMVAQKYVPAADLVLLVGRGDDLSFLSPMALPIPEIGDWRYQPEKFRIVTTYSTSAKSFVEYLKSSEQPSKELFRKRLFEQMYLFDKFTLPDDALPEYFYQLEFGDSWDELQRSDPELFSKISFVVDGPDGLFSDLHADINRSATKYGRIMAAIKTHKIAEKHRSIVLAVYETDLNKLCESKEHFQEQMIMFTAQLEKLEIKTKELKSEIKLWKESLADARAQIGNSIHSEGINNSVNKENIKELGYYLTNRHEDIMRSFDSFHISCDDRLTELVQGIPRNAISKCIDSFFDPVRSYLNEYWIDTYWVTSNFEKDLRKCRLTVTSAVQSVIELCIKHMDAAAENICKNLNSQISSIETQAVWYRESANNFQYKFNDDEQAIENLTAESAEFEKRMSYSIKLGNEFQTRITEAFSTEIRKRKRTIAEERNPAQRFMKLVAAVQFCDEKNKLFANYSS